MGATVSNKELEWKAEYIHNVWMLEAYRQGKHHPDMHRRDVYTVPHLRGDGQTYCNDCSLSMTPYNMLPEPVKQYDRTLILNLQKCEEAWKTSKDGKILPETNDEMFSKAGPNLPKNAWNPTPA